MIPQRYKRNACVFSVAYSPDGSLLAIAGDDRTVALYDTSTHQVQHVHHLNDSAFKITFSPCGTFFASGVWDCTVTLYHALYHTKIHEHVLTERVYYIAFSQDSNFIAFGGDNNFAVCNTYTHELENEFRVQEKNWKIRALEFSPDGKFLCVREDETIVMVYDSSTFDTVFQFERGNSIRTISFAPNGNFSIGGDDTIVATYDTSTIEDNFFHGYELENDDNGIACSPDRELIAKGGKNERVSDQEIFNLK